MDPGQFRTLSELVEEDAPNIKQKRCIHALPYTEEEGGDTLRSVYSMGQDDDGSSVYFSVNGSRASSMMMDGGPLFKTTAFSDGRETVSDCLDGEDLDQVSQGIDTREEKEFDHQDRDVMPQKQQDDFLGQKAPGEAWTSLFQTALDDGCEIKSTCGERKDIENPQGLDGEEQGEEEEVADHEEQERQGASSNGLKTNEPIKTGKWGSGSIMADTLGRETFTEGLVEDDISSEDVKVALEPRRLLSEADSVGPVLFPGSTMDGAGGPMLDLPTPIHEEGKGYEMSSEKKSREAPCQMCLEMKEHISSLQDSLGHMTEDLSNAYSEIAQYKKQILDIKEQLVHTSPSHDDEIEQLQEEIRYLRVVHTEEISALCAENGMLRRQMEDPDREDDYEKYQRLPQRRPAPTRRPKKLIIPEENRNAHAHKDSPDQIGYSPLGAARIQFK